MYRGPHVCICGADERKRAMTDAANTPRTAAGRDLLRFVAHGPGGYNAANRDYWLPLIIAIEAEAYEKGYRDSFADGKAEAAAPTPAEPLTGEALYRLWWQAAWDAMDNPRQWEQLSKDERGVWRMTADRLAAARPEADHD